MVDKPLAPRTKPEQQSVTSYWVGNGQANVPLCWRSAKANTCSLVACLSVLPFFYREISLTVGVEQVIRGDFHNKGLGHISGSCQSPGRLLRSVVEDSSRARGTTGR